jgi:hypothetical protein
MKRRSRLSVVLAMSLALGASALGVQPVAAARILKDTGTQGYYELYDEMGGPRGATCSYEKVTFDLDKMRIKPPLMHGYYPTPSQVQWRFKIRRQSLTPGATFKVFYTSSWQTDTADDAIPANGFTTRAWSAPEDPHGRFQAVVELRWRHNGQVEGFVRAQYEWYKAKWSGNSYENNEYCLEDY